MRTWLEWLQRLRGTVRRRRTDRDLEAELRLHLELAAEDAARRGDAEAVRRAARLRAGGVAQAMEALRDQRGLRWLDDLGRDLRHAIRALGRSPGFTAVALLTLALGIGANTAIFSIVNGVVLRPLGYPKPEQLMFLSTEFPALGASQFWLSPPEYLEFREMNASFAAVGAYATGGANLLAGDRAHRVRSASVDASLLAALGLDAAQGRLFAPGETEVTSPPLDPVQPIAQPPPIALLSHELWQTAFGGRSIVGDTIDVDGRPHEVVGVMAPGADLMDHRVELWLPLGLNPADRRNRASHFLYVVGRLKDGVSAQAARAELDTLLANWGERVGVEPGAGIASHVFVPLTNDGGGHILQMQPLAARVLGSAGRSIWILQAAVGLVLLVACANLANLLMARAEARHREFAVRAALGAGRGRLVRQFITEGLLLSMAGGALGLVLAHALVRALASVHPASLPRTSEVTVDGPVLLFTLVVAAATGVLFGVAPIVHTRVRTLAAALSDGGSRGTTRAARRHVRHGLVVIEVGLAVVLVAGAGLLVRTVYNLAAVDAGFDRSRLVTFALTLPSVAYPDSAARARLFQELLARLRALPEVQAATAMSGLPPNRPLNANATEIDNYIAAPEGPPESVDYYQAVMSDYFETMAIPIVAGRSFQAADAASSGLVAIVNESLVNTFWRDVNPIGQRLRPRAGDQAPWFTVVGVAGDVRQGGVDREPGTELYFFLDQLANLPSPQTGGPDSMHVVLRTSLPPAALAPAIEREVRGIDPAVPVAGLRTMETAFTEAISRPRLLAQLVAAFGALAVLLAAIGTYGVLSYMVAERRREIGVRLALGAGRGDVLVQVMRQGLMVAAIGIVSGLAVAVAVHRLMASLLFGVQPADLATLAAAAAAVTLVAVVACWLPAWRASRLDPNLVLRDD